MSTNQQPGSPEQPSSSGGDGSVPPPPPAAPGQPPYGSYPPHPEQPGQPQYPAQPPYPAQPQFGEQARYGEQNQYGVQPQYPAQPGQDPWAQPQYGAQQPYGVPPQPGQPGVAPGSKPKGGIPLWGWIGGGVVVVALLGVGGVVLANALAGALKPQPVPCGSGASGCLPPSPSASAPETSGEPSPSESAASGEVQSFYLFDDSDFTAPPVWSIQKPEGWQMQEVKGGTVTYRNASNNCLFTTHQAILPPTDETTDEGATALSMEQEIAAVKAQATGNVEVVDDSGSVYTKLRNSDDAVIELQEAELRFKNRKDVNLVYRIALRSMPGSDGLMELTQICPANAPDEDLVWSENTRSVTMRDDPSAKPKP